MAIIGKLTDVRNRYFKDSLTIVFDYLIAASTEGTKVRNRIFSRPLGAFEKVDIDDGIFALEQVFETRGRDECFFESHQKFVDFQLNLSGAEQMEFAPLIEMEVEEEYDEKKDLVVYRHTDMTTKILMRENDMAIYLPEDVHMGLGWVNGQINLVNKTVIKLPIEYFNV